MSDRSVDLFTAIYSALSGDSALATLLGGSGRIYDTPTPGAPAPYVVIGEETATDYGSSAGDAQEHTATLHVWSEKPSSLQCKQLMAAVRNVLHAQALSLGGGNLVYLRQEFKQVMPDPDGVSYHGVLRYRALTEN